MPAAKLSKEIWLEIKTASECGMDDDELSQTYNIPKNAIQQRKHREKWLTPRKLKELAMVQEAKDAARVMNNKTEGVSSVSADTPTALVNVAAKLTAIKETTFLALAEKTSELMLEGLKTLLAPKGWKEMSIASTVFSNAVGANKGGGMVIQVGGAAWQGSPQGEKPRIIQIEAQEV